MSTEDHTSSRRTFLQSAAASPLAWMIATSTAPGMIVRENRRPQLPSGVASGDVTYNSAMLWSRTDRPARMIAEIATNEKFSQARRIVGPDALAHSDFTAKLDVSDLPSDEQLFYRIQFQDLANPKIFSEPTVGRFRTPSRNSRSIKFAWAGDTAGQGFGINPDFGGMILYEAMRKLQPDFFIHSGDHIYADGPIEAEVRLKDGSSWKNLVTEAKSKVAETLDEFRGNYAYNFMDHNVQAFQAEVPQYVQWDDHETTNNWYPGEMLLDDDRYTVKSASLLAARGKQAFCEYTPIRTAAASNTKIYRNFAYGPLLEVFMLDMRSFRAANSGNRQTEPSQQTDLLGREQLDWLKTALKKSQSTWKVIASDMPIGLIVRDGKAHFENAANGDGPPLGRELEVAELLRFLKQESIRNVVWVTADVHYAAAHRYEPDRAIFKEFDGFWEFVAGPINAGTFGPNPLDNTFGPKVEWSSIPDGSASNLPPSDGKQFFGLVEIDSESQQLSVEFYNLYGQKLHRIEVPAHRA